MYDCWFQDVYTRTLYNSSLLKSLEYITTRKIIKVFRMTIVLVRRFQHRSCALTNRVQYEGVIL